MPEQETGGMNTPNSPDAASPSGLNAGPAGEDPNGEEQRNRLGYMVTEPTEEEIEAGDAAAEIDEEGEAEKGHS
ncbi:MAG: hypothetical protein H7Z41_09620 [Cytophagales bacterium]|nr:hypothetical protein [Armatimonadota bacterium]